MHRILKGEMVKANITVKELAMKMPTKITERSLRNKINGITDFTLKEAIAIRKIVCPEMSIEELFQSERKTA